MFYIPTFFVFLHKAKFLLKTPNKKSALSEIHGVAQPETLSTVVATQIQQFRRKQPSAEELIAGILKGDKTALSRAITLVESTNPEHTEKANEVIKADLFISNIDPKATLKMVGLSHFRKSYYERIDKLESVISAFSLYIVFKPNTFKYLNYNYYHFKNSNDVWTAYEYDENSWPKAYMASMNYSGKNGDWAEGMTFITYMKYEDVKEWEETFNTTAEKIDSGISYEEFKAQKTEKFLNEIEIKFPNIRSCIQSIHTSTPLSYRDYIGGNNGNMYGYVKDCNNPMLTFIAPKTKLDNLYLTGQSINMHGVLGVTIGAVLTCSEIVGKEYLVDKINQETK